MTAKKSPTVRPKDTTEQQLANLAVHGKRPTDLSLNKRRVAAKKSQG